MLSLNHRAAVSRIKPYMKKNFYLYLFVLPAIVSVFFFSYLPYPGLSMAFVKYNVAKGIGGSTFVGLQHFSELFSDPNFMRVMRNTLSISLIGFTFGFPLPIVFAIFLNELTSLKFKKFIQTTSYLPFFVSWVAIAGLMYQMFDEHTGIVNEIIKLFGRQPIAFFAEPKLFWGLSVGIAIWKNLGWSSIIYLASMSSISPELYDACSIDGGGRFRRMFHVTIPGIMPIITFMLILNAGAIFSGAGITPGFEGVYNLSNAVISDYSDILDIFIYKQGLRQMHYDYAAAMGLLFGSVNMILVVLANSIANRINDSGIF